MFVRTRGAARRLFLLECWAGFLLVPFHEIRQLVQQLGSLKSSYILSPCRLERLSGSRYRDINILRRSFTKQSVSSHLAIFWKLTTADLA